jgi:hypothetical protein
LKGRSSKHCTEAESVKALIVVHEEGTTTRSHAPLFWAKFHQEPPNENISCNPIHEYTIFSFGGKPQHRIWYETKTKDSTLGKRKYNTEHHTEITELLKYTMAKHS